MRANVTHIRAKMLIKFRDDNPQKFIKYVKSLEKIARELRIAFKECEPDTAFMDIYMKYVKLMADTPEIVDIDHDARMLLNNRILYMRRMFEFGRVGGEGRGALRSLTKKIVRARGQTKYAKVPI